MQGKRRENKSGHLIRHGKVMKLKKAKPVSDSEEVMAKLTEVRLPAICTHCHRKLEKIYRRSIYIEWDYLTSKYVNHYSYNDSDTVFYCPYCGVELFNVEALKGGMY